jgi:hypothetical protein
VIKLPYHGQTVDLGAPDSVQLVGGSYETRRNWAFVRVARYPTGIAEHKRTLREFRRFDAVYTLGDR